MGRKIASKAWREELDPHRNISRRSFLDRGSKVALAGLSAAATLGVPAPNTVWAQQATTAATRLAPDRFDYLPIIDRPVIKWPNNARVAFWVAPNIEWYEYTPYEQTHEPDIASYSYHDYGNRVGFWRMVEVLDKHKIRAASA